MLRAWGIRVLIALVALGITVTAATADEGSANLSAKLSGFNEVTPKLTTGSGTFHATIQGDKLTYRLTFSNLSSPAIMSHIHFAETNVNGGVFIWLCGSTNFPGPAGTPTCPAGGGTVSRTVTAADVVGLNAGAADQGLDPGDFAGAVRIIHSGDAYVNVHSQRYVGGEIRGQVHVGEAG